MQRNPPTKGVIRGNLAGIGPVTREMVHARTKELALLAGCAAPHVRQVDYEQAKRELTGEVDIDRQNAVLDELPESKRWDPVPGSGSTQAPESPSEDEDYEGRGENEQLLDGGAMRAERDRTFQAAKAAAGAEARHA